MNRFFIFLLISKWNETKWNEKQILWKRVFCVFGCFDNNTQHTTHKI
jgi:hypothetical protein